MASVNPSHAASPPGSPARRMPRAIPTWLLAGPGRNWHSATRSAYAASLSHFRRATISSRKYPSVRHRPAERRQPQPQKHGQHFPEGPLSRGVLLSRSPFLRQSVRVRPRRHSAVSTFRRSPRIHLRSNVSEGAATSDRSIIPYTHLRRTRDGRSGSSHSSFSDSFPSVAIPSRIGHSTASRSRMHLRGVASRYASAASKCSSALRIHGAIKCRALTALAGSSRSSGVRPTSASSVCGR